jgi:hypothetical protein
LGFLTGHQFSYFAVGVVQVAEYPGVANAGIDAGGFFALAKAVVTKPALFRHSRVVVHYPGLVWAGYHTVFTACASFFVYQHDTIFPAVAGLGGTDIDTGGIGAVHALDGEYLPGNIGKLAFLFGFNPAEPLSGRKSPFGLAGHGAGLTANTFFYVNDHCVSSHLSINLPF